ncbi:hypothetical protein J6590_041933 [Homalodisca vitripennis]|nr:hypothetical protein J6590_041933 [Homalodisca vitripennis]
MGKEHHLDYQYMMTYPEISETTLGQDGAMLRVFTPRLCLDWTIFVRQRGWKHDRVGVGATG